MNRGHKKRPVSAESIARDADTGKGVSTFFTNSGRMREPAHRVSVDFTSSMLRELDELVEELNISRQAAIKTMVRQALDYHYLAMRQAKIK